MFSQPGFQYLQVFTKKQEAAMKNMPGFNFGLMQAVSSHLGCWDNGMTWKYATFHCCSHQSTRLLIITTFPVQEWLLSNGTVSQGPSPILPCPPRVLAETSRQCLLLFPLLLLLPKSTFYFSLFIADRTSSSAISECLCSAVVIKYFRHRCPLFI